MRVKTFLATYLLFLCILYASLGIVSAYMTNSQTNMLKEKSVREYHSIAATLAKDIAVLHGRSGGSVGEGGSGEGGAGEGSAGAGGIGADISGQVNSLVTGYIRYYGRHNILLAVDDLTTAGQNGFADAEISYLQQGQEHFIHITGALPEPMGNYRLDYQLDITESIMEMQNVQRVLLLFAAIFSVVTAIALFFILSGIFKPLGIVASISRKIADGQYGQRIHVKGKHEPQSVAADFNRMAEKIENQIRALEDEAVGKQQFVDNFAHEIRTPLTSIYGWAEYMQKTSLDEREIIESAQYIMDEAGHMKNIASSLLELATLRNYTPQKDKIPVARLFDDISHLMDRPLREQRVQLACHCGKEILEGQEDLLKSLLTNLCHNALEACDAHVGVIHLSAEMQGENIVVSVADNGCGIPRECVAKVTEPFYRVDKSRSRKRGGAGLGLTLCRQIAEAHGAKMDIESASGAGTTVKITFTSSK